MATASVSNTFVNGTAADADEVNQNFTQLTDFLNQEVVQVDGSVAMTGAFDAGSNKIVNVTAPTVSTDAANKAYADSLVGAGAIDTAALAGDAVTEAKLADDAVSTGKLVDGAVTNAKIADNAVNSEHYANGSIDEAHLSSGCVTTSKLGADAVTAAKIANDAVGLEHIEANAVDTSQLVGGAVTDGKTDVSSWTSINLGGSWSNYPGRQAAQYRKRFDEVQMRGTIRNGTTTAGTLITTLPSGHRPPAALSVPITAASMDADGTQVINGTPRFLIETDGQVRLYGLNGSDGLGVPGRADVSFCFSFSVTS